MRIEQKQVQVISGRKARKKDQDALKNVVSLRISDQEKRVLERFTEATCKNVSEIVREAIDLWLTKQRRMCLGS